MAVIVKDMNMPTSCWNCRFLISKEQDKNDAMVYTGACIAKVERKNVHNEYQLFLFGCPRPKWCSS